MKGLRRHGLFCRIGADGEETVACVGGVGQHVLLGQRGPRHVLAHHVAQRQDGGGRRDGGRIDALQDRRVVQDRGELLAEERLLLIGEAQARQFRDVFDFGQR